MFLCVLDAFIASSFLIFSCVCMYPRHLEIGCIHFYVFCRQAENDEQMLDCLKQYSLWTHTRTTKTNKINGKTRDSWRVCIYKAYVFIKYYCYCYRREWKKKHKQQKASELQQDLNMCVPALFGFVSEPTEQNSKVSSNKESTYFEKWITKNANQHRTEFKVVQLPLLLPLSVCVCKWKRYCTGNPHRAKSEIFSPFKYIFFFIYSPFVYDGEKFCDCNFNDFIILAAIDGDLSNFNRHNH